MDIGIFQSAFPELLIVQNREGWEGELLEYFDLNKNKWIPLAPKGEALMFSLEGIDDKRIAGLINSTQVRELECALITVKEGSHTLIGLVRGKDLSTTTTEELELSPFEFFLEGQANKTQEEIFNDETNPDLFDVSSDLEDLLK